jgi:Lon protease-like protein
MFPLQSVLLPGEELPLRVFEPRYSALVADCLTTDDPGFGVVLIARGREVGGGDERHPVGVRVRIAVHEDYGQGRYRLNCPVQHRIRVTEWLDDDPYPRAVTEHWPDESGAVSADEMAGVEDDIWALYELIAHVRELALPDRDGLLGPGLPAEPGERLYALTSLVPIGAADRYAVLAAPGPADRLAVLREAIETVSAMVRFQSAEG